MIRTEAIPMKMAILDWIQKPISKIALILYTLSFWLLSLAVHWVCSLPCFLQVLLGMTVGFALMGSFSIHQRCRGHSRRLCSVHLSQISSASTVSLRKLLPDHEKALSWLPKPDDAEAARWINVAMEKFWPLLKEASLDMIKEQLFDVLNKYKPQVIQELRVAKLELGNSCPYVQGIKALHEEGNKMSLEVQIDWRDNENQQMVLNVLSSVPDNVVQVKNFVIYAVMKLTFMPFKEEFPCFGAMILSIVEPPLIDFQSRFICGDLIQMPEVKKAVDHTLLGTLTYLLVSPSRVVVPFIPGDYSDLEATCVGILNVQLVEAKGLANKYITGRSDPYAVLFIRRVDNLTKKSTLVHDTSDPIWNESFQFDIEDARVQKLTVKVMNWDDEGLDLCVGTAEIPINQLDENVWKDVWIDLMGEPQKLHEKSAGQVHLSLELKPRNFIDDEHGFITDQTSFSNPESSEILKLHRDKTALKVSSTMEGLKVVLDFMDVKTCNNASNPPDRSSSLDGLMIKEPNILDVNSKITVESAKVDDGNVDKADTKANSHGMNDGKVGLECSGNISSLSLDQTLSKIKDASTKEEVIPNAIESVTDTRSYMCLEDMACPSKVLKNTEAHFQENVSKAKCIKSTIIEVADTDANVGKPSENACIVQFENVTKTLPLEIEREGIDAMEKVINTGSGISMASLKTNVGKPSENACILQFENVPKTLPLEMEREVIDAMEEVINTEFINTGSGISMATLKTNEKGNDFNFEKDLDAHPEENERERCSCISQSPIENQSRSGNQDEPRRVWNIHDMLDSEIFEVD